MPSLVAIIKMLTASFTNRITFNRVTQTGNIHLHGSYLQLIHESFLFYTTSGYDLAVVGGNTPPLPCWAKKYFSYWLYFLGQILKAFEFWGEKRRESEPSNVEREVVEKKKNLERELESCLLLCTFRISRWPFWKDAEVWNIQHSTVVKLLNELTDFYNDFLFGKLLSVFLLTLSKRKMRREEDKNGKKIL